MIPLRHTLVATIGLVLLIVAPASSEPTAAEVREAVRSATDYLRREAGRSWAFNGRDQYNGGIGALATLALLHAGVAPTEQPVADSLRSIANLPDQWTYTAGVRIAVLALADPARYREDIDRSAEYLIRGQLQNGAWTYTTGNPLFAASGGDNSNTQFALLGLHEAARAGARIPRNVWMRAEKYWSTSQTREGGWGYTRGPGGPVTGSMTAAGVASLLICGNQLNESQEDGYTAAGVAPGCGKYAQNKALTAGLRWLGDNFNARQNPNNPQWHLYWLYGAERVGILSGLRYFGKHDWYREGADVLIDQQRANGSWNNSPVDTSFALLFLAKGKRPVLINKLAWARDNRWQPDRHDCENLVAFIGDKLGAPVSWETITPEADPVEMLRAPILYVTGHTFPVLSNNARARLRQYVDGGGTILVEACCSREAVAAGFRQFVEKTFPDQQLVPLGPEHPVWKSHFALEPGRFPLQGLDSGCRTSVIFSPRDLSCLWEQARVKGLSEEAFQLGTNIAAYATGLEPLRDKLDAVELPRRRSRPRDAALPVRGALQLAQLIHNGDWRPDPHSLAGLAELLHKQAGVDVVAQPRLLKPTDPELANHPIAYLTGHFSFRLTPDETRALRTWLDRGGFLFADACCGRAAFDTSFRELCRALYPQSPLRSLSTEHAILRGRPGYQIDRVKYRPTLAKEKPDLVTPVLEGIDIEGRTLIVYSPYSIGCGLEPHQCYSCRGLSQDDSGRVAVNIVLYALTN